MYKIQNFYFFLFLGTDSVDSEEDSDSDDESSGGTEGSCSYSDSNSDSDDESSGDEEEDTGSNSDCTSEHSEQTFSIQKTNFEPVYIRNLLLIQKFCCTRLDKIFNCIAGSA